MAAEIVKLRQVRKDKARADKAAQAAENRVRFGRTKAEKKGQESEQTRIRRELDGAKRSPDAGSNDDGQ